MTHLVLSSVQINVSYNQLCGLDWQGNGTYTAEGIKAIASAISVSASLTAADLRWNSLDLDAKQQVRDSVRGRDGFKLKL